MKAVINTISFDKEVETKFGTMYQFSISYGDKKATFLSNTKDQKQFEVNKENEFNETPREWKGQTYYNIKPLQNKGNSNFGRQLKREQSKYSGFAMSYAKDLVIADKIKLDDISKYTEKMFILMVKLDKTLES